jgi:hypothetical protein
VTPDWSFYLQFKNKHVRSLVWVLKSPNMLAKSLGKNSQLVDHNWGSSIIESSMQWLKDLDDNPQPLLEWINKKPSYRLGIRFEALISFIFQHLVKQQSIDNFSANIPIYDEAHKTLGELDLVYYDTQLKQRFHWENAIKYYLFNPKEYSFERWVGPNGADWLERKLDHLFSRQLGISNTIEAKIALGDCFTKDQNKTELNKRAFIKGYLLMPLSLPNLIEVPFNHEEKELISKTCLKGYWGFSDQFHLADPEQKGRWRMIEKLDWLTPQVYPYQDDDMLKPNEMSMKIKFHFMKSKRSMLIAHFLLDEETQLWLENKRVMIVDKLWPSYKEN